MFIPSAAQINNPQSNDLPVTPSGMAIPIFIVVAALGIDSSFFARVTIPKTGVLHDLSVFVGTVSGNYSVSVYDTGDALPGSRTKLWDSGSVSVAAGTNVYKIVGDPSLPVVIGQQLDFGYSAGNTTLTTGRLNLGVAGQSGPLPAGFNVPSGGAQAKMSSQGPGLSPTGTWPATIAEASLTSINHVPLVFGRIS